MQTIWQKYQVQICLASADMHDMKRYAGRQTAPWAAFGLLMIISLTAWLAGSAGLALALASGALGAMFFAFDEKVPVRRFVRRILFVARHQG